MDECTWLHTIHVVSNVVVIGGGGRAGLPFAVALAQAGHDVCALDADTERVSAVAAGLAPFAQSELTESLAGAVTSGRLRAVAAAGPARPGPGQWGELVRRADVVVVSTNPQIAAETGSAAEAGITALIRGLVPCLRDGQLLVLRSTLLPGTCAAVEDVLATASLPVDVAVVPERGLEGRMLEGLGEVPLLVGGRAPHVTERVADLVRGLVPSVIALTPEEAEFAKLVGNAWRYVQFAFANETSMALADHGVDFDRVRGAVTSSPLNADLPRAGLVGGPCLPKDSAALRNVAPSMGLLDRALMVNSTFPLQVAWQVEEVVDVTCATVGVLGLSFKPGSDDLRGSLAVELVRILRERGARVLVCDPHVAGTESLEDVLAASDVLVVATPHEQFASVQAGMPVIDPFGIVAAARGPRAAGSPAVLAENPA